MKHLSATYRITYIDPASMWFDRQPQLIGYRGTLLSQGVNLYTLKMLDGPHTGQTVTINGARLLRASSAITCRCKAYPFPHRYGSGDCLAEAPGPFCEDCGQPCSSVPLDNSFSYSGTHCTGGHSGTHRPAGYGSPSSDCCGAEVFTTQNF